MSNIANCYARPQTIAHLSVYKASYLLYFPITKNPVRLKIMPDLLEYGGPMMWVICATGAIATVVFLERMITYHRVQINSSEFVNGVKNVLQMGNDLEAISICEATPGPIPRLVRSAVINRAKGKDGIREGLEECGLMEVPRLESKLNVLATIAQIAPLMGLLGTVLGLMDVYKAIELEGLAGSLVTVPDVSGGIWQALICTASGIALAIPCYAGYNYLVGRVNTIIIDMEKASMDILNILSIDRVVGQSKEDEMTSGNEQSDSFLQDSPKS